MDELEKLKLENEDLKDKLIDLSFEMNYNKQTELIEFLRDLYKSINLERLKDVSKEEILENLKTNIQEFCKNNKIYL
jgi:hypothetical protein